MTAEKLAGEYQRSCKITRGNFEAQRGNIDVGTIHPIADHRVDDLLVDFILGRYENGGVGHTADGCFGVGVSKRREPIDE